MVLPNLQARQPNTTQSQPPLLNHEQRQRNTGPYLLHLENQAAINTSSGSLPPNLTEVTWGREVDRERGKQTHYQSVLIMTKSLRGLQNLQNRWWVLGCFGTVPWCYPSPSQTTWLCTLATCQHVKALHSILLQMPAFTN